MQGGGARTKNLRSFLLFIDFSLPPYILVKDASTLGADYLTNIYINVNVATADCAAICACNTIIMIFYQTAVPPLSCCFCKRANTLSWVQTIIGSNSKMNSL